MIFGGYFHFIEINNKYKMHCVVGVDRICIEDNQVRQELLL